MIAWLTTYDHWLLLRNFALVLVWNFYCDCLTDCTWPCNGFCRQTLHQFLSETFVWLSYFFSLWILLQKNECVRLYSEWQALLTAQRILLQQHVISFALKYNLSLYHIWKHLQYCFYTETERSLSLLGFNVNDEWENHPLLVETLSSWKPQTLAYVVGAWFSVVLS